MSQSLPVLNLAFYHFVNIKRLSQVKAELQALCDTHHLKGSMILSYEGINGMMAGLEDDARVLVDFFAQHPDFKTMHVKESWSEEIPFERLLIKVKPEIVTMRVDGVRADEQTGTHLSPEAFRDMLREEADNLVVIDVRNDFEYQLGTFKNALNPNTIAFHEFPDVVRENKADWTKKKVAMFCTGGIRCEKASSWMLDEGFEEVFQLEGGVLNYFERIEDAERDWDGELFVFDHRVALDTKLQATQTELCQNCGHPVQVQETACSRCGQEVVVAQV